MWLWVRSLASPVKEGWGVCCPAAAQTAPVGFSSTTRDQRWPLLTGRQERVQWAGRGCRQGRALPVLAMGAGCRATEAESGTGFPCASNQPFVHLLLSPPLAAAARGVSGSHYELSPSAPFLGLSPASPGCSQGARVTAHEPGLLITGTPTAARAELGLFKLFSGWDRARRGGS